MCMMAVAVAVMLWRCAIHCHLPLGVDHVSDEFFLPGRVSLHDLCIACVDACGHKCAHSDTQLYSKCRATHWGTTFSYTVSDSRSGATPR